MSRPEVRVVRWARFVAAAVSGSRRAAVIRLLETRDENLPEPVRRVEAAAGFVHDGRDHRETCPDCLANDRRMFGCETCGGAGWVRAPRMRDPYATGNVVDYGFGLSRHDEARARDRAIDALAQQTAGPRSEADLLEEANAHPYPWEIARRRMYRLFDYAALDAALERLRDSDAAAYRALHAVYVYGWLPVEYAPAALLERGLSFVEGRLPDPLRAPDPEPGLRVRGPVRPEAGVAARELRDGELRRRAAEGASPAELAQEFRVSIRTVYRVVSGAAA